MALRHRVWASFLILGVAGCEPALGGGPDAGAGGSATSSSASSSGAGGSMPKCAPRFPNPPMPDEDYGPIFPADLDGDGNTDLVRLDMNAVFTLHGNGDGTFDAPVTLWSVQCLSEPAFVDLNGDGKVDVAFLGPGGKVHVMLGQGGGAFAAPVLYDVPYGAGSYGPSWLTTADLNGDGKPDLVAHAANTQSVSVLLNQGSGTFTAASNSPAGANPGKGAAGDLNGDGHVDIAVVDATGIAMLLGNGTGAVTMGPHLDAANISGPVRVSDFDGDGNADIAVAAAGGVRVFRNAGNGTFAAPVDAPVSLSTAGFTVGDVNGDGKPDILADIGQGHVAVLRNQGDGTFAAATRYLAGSNVNNVALGDVNGDGMPDILAGLQAGASVLLNAGSGTFESVADYPSGGATPAAAPPEIPVGGAPSLVTVADLDGDQRLDVATANANGTLSVLLGHGDGTFTALPDQTIPAPGQAIAASDLNGDGKTDIVFGRASTVSVLLGKGDGTFAPAVDFAAAAGLKAVAIGDLNGDGEPDIAVIAGTITLGPTNWTESFTLSVLFNNGNGTFAAPVTETQWSVMGTTIPEPSLVAGVAASDLNGDGKVDIAAAIGPKDAVSVLLGQGNGAFAAPVDFAAGKGPGALTIGDMNQDGKPDLVTGPGGVLLNAGNGTFMPASTTISVQSVQVADLNGDGRLDIIGCSNSVVVDHNRIDGVPSLVSYTTGTQSGCAVGDLNDDGKPDIAVPFPSQHTVGVWLNTGHGFPQQIFTAEPGAVATGDLDGDGKPDVAVTNPASNTASVLRNTGNGTFAAAVEYAVGDHPLSVAIGDLDGDGKPDLAVTNQGEDVLDVLLNNGDGTFAPAAVHPVGSGYLAMGDLDGDGKLDVVMASFEDDDVRVLFGAGDGTFSGGATYTAGAFPSAVAIGDLDGDGKLDIAVGNMRSGTVSVLLNQGNGTFAAAVDYPAMAAPRSIAIGDLDGDGKPDLAVGGRAAVYREVDVLLNQGAGTFAPANVYSTTAYGASLDSVTIADVNGDGLLDLVSAGMRVWLNQGNGTFGPARRYVVGEPYSYAAAADFDGDGRIDFAVATGLTPSMNVILNRGCP